MRLQRVGQDWNNFTFIWASLVAQLVKNPPAMWESWFRSLGWEDSLEKWKVTQSSILAWRIPWTTVHGVTKSWTLMNDFHFQTLKKKKNDDNKPKGIREEVTKVVTVVQSLSCVWIFVTPWTAACQVSLSLTFSQSLCKLTSIVLMMPSISSSVFPFFLCLHPFPASESFPMSWLFPTGGQSIEPSASASVLPMNIQG